MRCIPFLLLGLISATYAIPTPLPQAGSQHDRYPSGPLFPLQSITNQVIYEHWARSAETDIEKWTSPDALSVQDALLYQDAQHWAAEFIEQRLFREALGVQARFPRDGRKVLYSHPRHLRFRLLSPYLYVIAVRGFVMSKSPADITAHLAVDHDFLFATKTACDVEVDFGDKFAVAHFKPLHAEDNPHRDPKIIIPLNDRDRELFKKCDDLVSGRSGSTTLDHDPHSHNSPVIPTRSSPPQGPDDFPPHDDHNPPSTPPSHNNPPARHAYPNQSPPPPYEPY